MGQIFTGFKIKERHSKSIVSLTAYLANFVDVMLFIRAYGLFALTEADVLFLFYDLERRKS